MSVGAGPIESGLSKIFIKQVLSLASYRSYRDLASKQLIDSIGFHKNDPVYSDLAWSLHLEKMIHADTPPGKYKKIGIGPMTWYDPRIWPKKDQSLYQGYVQKLGEFTAWLIQKGYCITFIPGEPVHDQMTIEDILIALSKMGIAADDERITRLPIDTVEQLAEEIATIDLFVGSRLHNIIFSLACNKPVLAISYHQKMNVLMNEFGLSRYCMPIESFDVAKACSLFNEMVDRSEDIRSNITKIYPEYIASLTEQYKHVFSFIQGDNAN